ncbi:response regulator transcription factor [Gudongella sp. DL1XJH-153]|uniref:response regulator transcription factor n=1 Tax=Gudongella sp. DL1XJH-153 TaxID=3409804 RepID=UPI003BB7D19E
MKQKVLIIDDDIELCDLVKKYLETEGYEVTTKHNGTDGLMEGLTNSFQLVVLDVMLPQKNGFDVLADLRKKSGVPVLMLTAKDSEIDKVLGLRLGADDYLTKPFSMNEFIARVQSIIRRYTALGGESVAVSASMLTFDNLSITPASRQVIVSEAPVELTAKEFDLLYFLADNNGMVFTKKQIYRAVWKDEYAFDDNNIMVHIRRLRKKIEPNPEQPQFIQTVWGVGYKFDGSNSI